MFGDLQSFITCPLAVNWVGFVLICYGACDSIFSFSFGRVEKYTGRWPLFTLAFLINIALIIVFQVSEDVVFGFNASRASMEIGLLRKLPH